MFISICTPTHNRGYILSRVYENLKKQTDKDFEWIVVDDGSNDETENLVANWINENVINIKYYYQNNYGKHIALNNGVSIADGKVFTCLDSDDWLLKNAVEVIKKEWTYVDNNRKLAGIITLDSFESGLIVGDAFPEKLSKANWIDLQYKYKITGDKAFYFKTELIREYDFPSFPNNKHMPPSYQYFKLSEFYDFQLLNEPTKYVEYLSDGISRNKYKKYLIAPDNFALYRLEIMDLIPTFKRKIINCIHFNSSQKLGKVQLKPKKSRNILMVYITKPAGFLLSLFLMHNA